jgi:siderophore synthetase component
MAKKTRSNNKFDKDVARELESAIETELAQETSAPDDVTASMADLEAQISKAADEIARESRNEAPLVQQQPLQPAGFAPANDDRQRDYKAIVQRLNRRKSNAVYWLTALLSALWVGAAYFVAEALDGARPVKHRLAGGKRLHGRMS